MGVYLVKKKGWRYDFVLNRTRHTDQWFPTKNEAVKAEYSRREELLNPPPTPEQSETATVITFLELVNMRLDHVKAYNSVRYYDDHVYVARRWATRWEKLEIKTVTRLMVENLCLERRKISAYAANKELRYLRAMFNFARKRGLADLDPTEGIAFFPEDKSLKYCPPVQDLEKVVALADQDTQDYLNTLQDTMARVGEVNNLLWDDVDLTNGFLALYTRKKKGGHRTPRKIPLTKRLYEILTRRYASKAKDMPWVFWHEYRNAQGEQVRGPYENRKKLMRGLCQKAGVRYFRYHAFRHSGASVMEGQNVPVSSIQRILGHESRKTTEIYLHSLGASEREAINVFEAFREKSHTDSHTGAGNPSLGAGSDAGSENLRRLPVVKSAPITGEKSCQTAKAQNGGKP